MPDPNAPVLPNGVLGNYWDGNTFVVPQQEAQSSATYWSGAPSGNAGMGGLGGYGGSFNPLLYASNYGGTPATGGALGSGMGWLNGSTGVLGGYNSIPGGMSLGPTFNNLADQELRYYLGQNLK